MAETTATVIRKRSYPRFNCSVYVRDAVTGAPLTLADARTTDRPHTVISAFDGKVLADVRPENGRWNVTAFLMGAFGMAR